MIEGQVAAIINERELAINRGEKHGVVEGMKFAVTDPKGVQITDPETGAELATIVIEKVRVQVTEVAPDYSIARTYQRTPGRDPLGALGFSDLLRVVPSRVRTLRTDEALSKPLAEAESFVKRGDRVRQVKDDD